MLAEGTTGTYCEEEPGDKEGGLSSDRENLSLLCEASGCAGSASWSI